MDTAVIPSPLGGTSLRYRVDGMDCPSCAAKIEAALRRLGGIKESRVDYAGQTLALRLDEAITPREAVERSVRALGFQLRALGEPDLMALASVADVPAPDTSGDWRRWWQSARLRLLTAVGVLLAAGAVLGRFVPALGDWATLPAVLLGLFSAGRRAVALARSGSPLSIEMLMAVAVVGAVLIGAPAEAATVVWLFTAGEVIEGLAASRARAGIEALTALVPRTALLVEDEAVRPVPAASVQVGQVVLVRPGDCVPVDGTVVEGASELDESPVTGESVPVSKQEGDALLAGSVNGSAALRVQATRPAADNTIARIVHMVEEAHASRAPAARFIERFSARYTPAVVAVAALTAPVPPLLFGAAWTTWMYRSLALLLIGCPCALVLSTPAAITAAIAAGARASGTEAEGRAMTPHQRLLTPVVAAPRHGLPVDRARAGMTVPGVRLGAALLAGAVAIGVNTGLLAAMDTLGLRTAHGGLLRLLQQLGAEIARPLGLAG